MMSRAYLVVSVLSGLALLPSAIYVYNATTGMRLNEFTMAAAVSSGASVVDGVVYVGYGAFGNSGGVEAFALP